MKQEHEQQEADQGSDQGQMFGREPERFQRPNGDPSQAVEHGDQQKGGKSFRFELNQGIQQRQRDAAQLSGSIVLVSPLALRVSQ